MFVLDLFEERAASSSAARRAIALEDGRFVSYGELDGLANQISRVVGHIMKSNNSASVSEETVFEDGKVNTPLVALMMDRDVAFIASMLGVLKAEAGYVPVDPTFPSDRQSYIFEQSQCQCLIIDEENYSAALNLGVQLPKNVIRIDTKTAKILDPVIPEQALPPVVPASQRVNDPDSLAYILYTSGSTGKPKGVMVKNAGVINQIEWFTNDLKSGPHSVILGLATFCFDISVLEIYLPLTQGGMLVLAKASTQKDPFRILELIEQHKVNFFQATPTTYDMMFAIGWQGDANIDFLVGGEAFRPSLLPAVRNCHSFRNVYGPTETTVWASSYVVPRDYGGVSIPPVGAPGRGYVFRVIDFQKGAPWREVEPGQEGELWIGGNSVGRGYLRRPDLTKEVYLPDTFAGHGLIYRTGDLVKLLPDGVNYQFLQRIDNQVKIDGFRIELQEIENVYISHPLVEQAVSLVKNKRLVIYIKPSSKDRKMCALQQQEVHDFARKQLMYYMMPKDTVIVDGFVLTATSKIDRKALPDPPPPADEVMIEEPEEGAAVVKAGAVGTRKQLQMEDLVVAAVLKMRGKRVLPTANFATIGIDSLGSILFIKFLSDRLGGVRIEPKQLYTPGVTIRSFSKALHERLATEKPQTLTDLGLSLDPSEGADDLENGGGGENAQDENDDALEDWEREQEEDFERAVLANKVFHDGMRGVFAFLVLWDHFRPVTEDISNAFVADTSLFVLYSGFTTVLQVRETPKYRWKNKEARKQALAAKTSVLPAAASEREIIPRAPFNWKSFLFSRACGVFPIMWLALAIYAPIQILQNKLRKEEVENGWIADNPQWESDEKICNVLYVFALNCWYRDETGKGCKYHGPNQILYASIIWGIFMEYALWRVLLEIVQNRAMRLDGPEGSWRRGVREFFERISYNRPRDWNEVALWGFGWLCLSVTFTTSLLAAAMKNGLSFLPHFFLGVTGAHIFECIHYMRFKTRRQLSKEAAKPAAAQGTGCVIADSSDSLHPSMTALSVVSGAGSTVEECGVGKSKADAHAQDSSLLRIAVCAWPAEPAENRAWNRARIARLLWRFLPDMLAIVVGITMSTLTPALNARDPGDGRGPVTWFMYCGLPLEFLAFGIVSMLQEGNDAVNGSRKVAENIIFTSLGYCCYPLYLFQLFVLNQWRASLDHYSQTGSWALSYNDPKRTETRPGQPQHSTAYMTACILPLIGICYALQYLVQDCFVGWVYSKIVGCWGSRRGGASAAMGSAM